MTFSLRMNLFTYYLFDLSKTLYYFIYYSIICLKLTSKTHLIHALLVEISSNLIMLITRPISKDNFVNNRRSLRAHESLPHLTVINYEWQSKPHLMTFRPISWAFRTSLNHFGLSASWKVYKTNHFPRLATRSKSWYTFIHPKKNSHCLLASMR